MPGVFLGSSSNDAIPTRAQNPKSVLANRRQVRTARQERHLVSSLCQTRTVVATDGAGAENRYAQVYGSFVTIVWPAPKLPPKKLKLPGVIVIPWKYDPLVAL